VELAAGIAVDDDVLAELCRAHGIRRMALFGSALRDDLRADGDIDPLAEFDADCTPGLLGVAELEPALDELLRLALTKLVEIVGEAAKQVTDSTRAAYRDVPWSAAARMRDRLIHHDFDIDLDVLWATVTDDLPRLPAALGDD
jgi:predicted nucleotidyltransferase